jgi:hypothetical protein
MARFNVGNMANCVENGVEIEVCVIGMSTEKDVYYVRTIDDKTLAVPANGLLRTKGPFFDIRGIVLTTSIDHPDEQGEIVALGIGPKGRIFYRVRFADRSSQWLSEDDVFLQTMPKAAVA